MSNDTLMDPRDFAERLEGGFSAEPPHAPIADDLARGRRRLRRRRAGTTIAALATVGIVTAGASLATGIFPHEAREIAPADSPRVITADEIVATCLRKENVMAQAPQPGPNPPAEPDPDRLLGDARLMTSALIANRVEATLLSEDGSLWGACQFPAHPEAGVKSAISIYRTDITFPRLTVDGVDAYEPADEADPDLAATADPPLPQLEVPCPSVDGGEAERLAAQAQCPEFTAYWNDRRPPEVAAARVTTPDGVSSWADVKRGYVSFAYTGRMTPEIAALVARGAAPGATRVELYDKDGNLLVDDRDPGQPRQDGAISIANFPSLAWWRR